MYFFAFFCRLVPAGPGPALAAGGGLLLRSAGPLPGPHPAGGELAAGGRGGPAGAGRYRAAWGCGGPGRAERAYRSGHVLFLPTGLQRRGGPAAGPQGPAAGPGPASLRGVRLVRGNAKPLPRPGRPAPRPPAGLLPGGDVAVLPPLPGADHSLCRKAV